MLFLFNVKTRQLLGVLHPHGPAGLDLEPAAWGGGRFPVHVRPLSQTLALAPTPSLSPNPNPNPNPDPNHKPNTNPNPNPSPKPKA